MQAPCRWHPQQWQRECIGHVNTGERESLRGFDVDGRETDTVVLDVLFHHLFAAVAANDNDFHLVFLHFSIMLHNAGHDGETRATP